MLRLRLLISNSAEDMALSLPECCGYTVEMTRKFLTQRPQAYNRDKRTFPSNPSDKIASYNERSVNRAIYISEIDEKKGIERPRNEQIRAVDHPQTIAL